MQEQLGYGRDLAAGMVTGWTGGGRASRDHCRYHDSDAAKELALRRPRAFAQADKPRKADKLLTGHVSDKPSLCSGATDKPTLCSGATLQTPMNC